MPIKDILNELQKRRQGYLFGGPKVEWCLPHNHKEKFIEIDGKYFTGCVKYASCDIVEETIKWTKWEDLTIDQKTKLADCRCYRASKYNKVNERDILWDQKYIGERQDNPWIGNPFGIKKSDFQYNDIPKPHRDVNPCKTGGCITPEMQAQYHLSNQTGFIQLKNIDSSKYWGNFKACPFYYRAFDENFSHFVQNTMRFAQCYITQSTVRDFLKINGFIAGSSLFKEEKLEKDKIKESYWYPFFSGYSYIQLPYNLKNSKRVSLIPDQLRWHATSIQRIKTVNEGNSFLPNTITAFGKCSLPEYATNRFWDVSDGRASWFLLTWIIYRRSYRRTSINGELDASVKWCYVDNTELFQKLEALGFRYCLEDTLKLRKEGGRTYRISTLKEDIFLLGLSESENDFIPTKRFDFLVTWLLKKEEKDLKEIIIHGNIKKIEGKYSIENVISLFVEQVKTIKANKKKEKKFLALDFLNPPVHLIVRAFLPTPIRWSFIPFNTQINNQKVIEPTSAMILLMEDSLESRAFKPSIEDENNYITQRVKNIFPLLSAINSIEEQNLRDDQVKKQIEIEVDKEKHAVKAAIAQVITRNLSHNIGSHVLSKLLTSNHIKEIYRQNASEYSCENMINNTFTALYPNETLIADFFSYLKSRMDYLTDVTTSTPVIENSKSFYNEIILGFLRNRILTDRISGLDKLKYKIIVCNPPKEFAEYSCKKNDSVDTCKYELNDKREDLIVGIPNDILGSHAFYTILENIIRNTAKHSKTNNNLRFHIKIEDAVNFDNLACNDNLKDKLESLYAVSIFDNSPIDNTIEVNIGLEYQDNEQKYNQWIKNKRKKGEKITALTKLVFDQNYRLNQSILENGQLRYGGWGLIEMDASAAYLRRIPVDQIDSSEYNIDIDDGKNIFSNNDEKKVIILRAYAEQGKYLGYRFFIPKPQNILIIGDDSDIFDDSLNRELKEETKKILKRAGIWIIDNFKANEIYPHKLVIDVREEEIKRTNPLTPTCFSKKILQYLPQKIKNYKDTPTLIKVLLLNWYVHNQYPYYTDNDFISSIKPIVPELLSKLENLEKRQNAEILFHGSGYCCRDDSSFIEIKTSVTTQFFSEGSLIQRTFSWPIQILVIDERIQYHAIHGKYYVELGECKPDCSCSQGISFSKIYEKTNIIVPSKIDCDLNEQSFETNNEFRKILNYISGRIDSVEFIVIHLGIIEKLIQSYNKIVLPDLPHKAETGEGVGMYILNVICGERESIYDKVIITSGRGTPHNLPPNIRYLNFSIISQYMIDLRNKYALTEALFSARRTNKKQ